mmetsp:Transcript_35083/g.96927  ORF Transcript_35083/g.96927 Transcript_35083/m.96927 type:complete len:494 (-) Transcript_35083:401-1882(-)
METDGEDGMPLARGQAMMTGASIRVATGPVTMAPTITRMDGCAGPLTVDVAQALFTLMTGQDDGDWPKLDSANMAHVEASLLDAHVRFGSLNNSDRCAAEWIVRYAQDNSPVGEMHMEPYLRRLCFGTIRLALHEAALELGFRQSSMSFILAVPFLAPTFTISCRTAMAWKEAMHAVNVSQFMLRAPSNGLADRIAYWAPSKQTSSIEQVPLEIRRNISSVSSHPSHLSSVDVALVNRLTSLNESATDPGASIGDFVAATNIMIKHLDGMGWFLHPAATGSQDCMVEIAVRAKSVIEGLELVDKGLYRSTYMSPSESEVEAIAAALRTEQGMEPNTPLTEKACRALEKRMKVKFVIIDATMEGDPLRTRPTEARILEEAASDCTAYDWVVAARTKRGHCDHVSQATCDTSLINHPEVTADPPAVVPLPVFFSQLTADQLRQAMEDAGFKWGHCDELFVSQRSPITGQQEFIPLGGDDLPLGDADAEQGNTGCL